MMQMLTRTKREQAATMALALVFFCGCQKKPNETQEVQLYRKPSASELFELESKCNALGQKIMQDNIVGNALSQTQLSHYNSADNRCYVLLNVSTADLRTPTEQQTSDYFLKDGQTSDILATRYCKGTKCSAIVFDKKIKGMLIDPMVPNELEVSVLMEKFVQPSRMLPQGKTP